MRLIGLVLCMTQSVFGQVLNNELGQAFTDKPFFNEDFIRSNHIESIHGQFNYKKPGEPMNSTEYFYVYQFDTLGHLIHTFETRKDDGTEDTTWHHYAYTDFDLLHTYKRGDEEGLVAVRYTYDENKRIIKEENWTEELDSNGKTKQALLLNSESMKYQDYGLQQKKTVFNSYDLPYITEMSYWNEDGYLLEKERKLLMTSETYHTTYDYNQKGLLERVVTKKHGVDKPIEEMAFIYDEFGNLEEKKHYRNGEFITETEIIYNSKSKLMTAVLIRDVKTDFIMIIRFMDYRYHEG